MKNLFDIVDFYESIKQKDLFPDSVFTDDALQEIVSIINKKNEAFFHLVDQESLKKDFGFKGLEIILKKLSDIHQDVSFNLSEYSIPKIENTPLFKFKIEFNSSSLTSALSQIEITDGISSIYWYLNEHFQDDLKFGDEIRRYRYTPAYVDNEGYVRHIYSKFIDDDFLKNELYGYREYWVKKIDEFLRYIPSEINISLPIDHLTSRFNEIDGDEPDDMSNRNELQGFLDSFGVISDTSGTLGVYIDKLVEKQNRRLKIKYQPQSKTQNPAIWFKSLPKHKKNETFELLKNVFDRINKHCPNTQWSDFKSIFNKNGSKVKITWTGDADLLNYIFRKQQKTLCFSGGKWKAVAHYFRRQDINDTSLSADKLAGSSHYDKNKDKILVEHLESLVSVLN